MSTNDERTALSAARFRCLLPRRSFGAGLLGLLLAVVLCRSPLLGQAAPAGGTTAVDSATLHLSAVAAVNAYEVAAFHYWPSAARPCAVGGDSADCAGGWCEPTLTRGSCLTGRLVPCPIYSSAVAPPFCDTDAAKLGPAYRTRDSVAMAADRDTLLLTLASVEDRIPGDGWVIGQRLYYLLMAGRNVDAIRAAGSCRADAAWCELLNGYVHERSGGADVAEVSFKNAERLLTPESRCEWLDIGTILPSEASKAAYEAMPCGSAARNAFEARFWWLSDPSWLVPGNDRRTEHIARKVDDKLLTEWLNAYCDSCVQVRGATVRPTIVTNDMEMIRTGPNDSWWTQSVVGSIVRVPARGGRGGGGRGAGGGGGAAGGRGAPPPASARGPADSSADKPAAAWLSPSVVRRSTSARFHFVPVDHALTVPLAATAADWRPLGGPPVGVSRLIVPDDSLTRSPIPERFTPHYAASVVPVSRWQAGFVRRGDSAMIVTAFDLSEDAALRSILGSSVGAEMTWSSGLVGFAHLRMEEGTPRDSFVMRRDDFPHVRWTGTVTAPWDSVLLGFEALGARPPGMPPSALPSSIMARARFGMTPPVEPRQRVQLSDLFVFDTTGGLTVGADGVDAVLDRLNATSRVDSGSTIGLYWENYGVAPTDKARMHLEVVQLGIHRGRLQGLSRSLTGANDVVIDKQWADAPPADKAAQSSARTFAVSLKSLPPGDYALQLTLSASGQKAVMVTRKISIGGP